MTEDLLHQRDIEQGKREMIIRLPKDSALSIEKIADVAQPTVAHVKQAAKKLKKQTSLPTVIYG
ncbi:MAG: hypothetical protein H7Z75_04665 [Ferruginibacter sp.]|nr:hypothetical protein [Cytophagales bacterium]